MMCKKDEKQMLLVEGNPDNVALAAYRCIQRPVNFDQFRSSSQLLGYCPLPVNQAVPPNGFEKTNRGRPA